jgi:uncharacterized cofD-like protein
VEQASVCAEYGDGTQTRGEVEVDELQSEGRLVRRVWLDPVPRIHPAVAVAIPEFDAAVIGPGSFFTSLLPPLLVSGMREALAPMKGPVVLVANLLTEGRGMSGFTAADAVRWIGTVTGRDVDVLLVNQGRPDEDVLARYAAEHKHPLPLGDVPASCEVVEGEFWDGEIARHSRRRLSYALWGVLARRLLD